MWHCRKKGGIWIHSSSLGEAGEALILARGLSRAGHHIVLSSTTSSGYKYLVRKAPKECDVFLQPIDHPLCTGVAARSVMPKILVIMESDFWIGQIYAAKRCGAKIIVANGRLSQKSIRMYRFFRFYAKFLWEMVDVVFARNADEARKFVIAGFPKEKVKILGDLKLVPVPSDDGIPKKPKRYPIVVAGSVRPEEEKLIINSFIELHKFFPNAVIVIAPRHQDRFEPLAQILREMSLQFVRRSRGQHIENGTQVLLLDTLGELATFYAIGDIAIIGGTFAKYGGHNPMEAVFHGVPVIHGHDIRNNKALFEMIDSSGAGMSVSAGELAIKMVELCSDKQRLDSMSRKSVEISENLHDIAAKYIENISEHL